MVIVDVGFYFFIFNIILKCYQYINLALIVFINADDLVRW